MLVFGDYRIERMTTDEERKGTAEVSLPLTTVQRKIIGRAREGEPDLVVGDTTRSRIARHFGEWSTKAPEVIEFHNGRAYFEASHQNHWAPLIYSSGLRVGCLYAFNPSDQISNNYLDKAINRDPRHSFIKDGEVWVQLDPSKSYQPQRLKSLFIAEAFFGTPRLCFQEGWSLVEGHPFAGQVVLSETFPFQIREGYYGLITGTTFGRQINSLRIGPQEESRQRRQMVEIVNPNPPEAKEQYLRVKVFPNKNPI